MELFGRFWELNPGLWKLVFESEQYEGMDAYPLANDLE